MIKYRSRSHMLLLYPDNEQHRNAFEKIVKSYDYASIVHDKDYFTEEDEKKNKEHKQGQLKKLHIHVVLRFAQAKWNTAICKELGIDERFCEEVKRFDNALLYLIHYNDNDKAQYDIEEVQGNLKNRIREIINKSEKSEGEKVNELFDFIDSRDSYITTRDFGRYCSQNGYWSEYRRSASIFHRIIDEHNYRIEMQNKKERGER